MEYSPPNHGGRVFARATRRHAFAAKKTRLAARKIVRTLAAFSLPQDSQVELMFSAARFGEPALSASRGLGFHVAPRRGRLPHRLDNPRKCFNPHRILRPARRPNPP
jgi:hypothetical protein